MTNHVMTAAAAPDPPSICPGYPEAAVGAFVFKGDRILLVKRSRPPAEGEWAIPGGRIRLGETFRRAAEREILEETGIRIKAGKPAYVFDGIFKDSEEDVRYHYLVVDVEGKYVSGEPRAGSDAEEARWISRDVFFRLNVNQHTREALRSRFNFP